MMATSVELAWSLPVVDGLPGSDRGNQVDMFLHERVGYVPFRGGLPFGRVGILPDHLAVPVVQFSCRAGIPFRAVNLFHLPVGAAIYLPGRAVGTHPVLVEVLDAEKVVLVAGNPTLTATPATCLYGVLAQVPVHHVDLVNELLGDMVSR